MTKRASPIPAGYHTVTPYLIVPDAPALIAFAERAFGAALERRWDGPDGSVRHAEIRIGDSMIMLGEASDECPPMPTMLHLYVEDVDAVYRSALAAGATALREPSDMPYGDRSGGVLDAAGNQWWLATRLEDLTDAEIARRAAVQDAAATAEG